MNTYLFPEWFKPIGSSSPSQIYYEKLMKSFNHDASRFFGWPSCLAYHGTHNFRHGAAQDAFKEKGLELVMLRTGHVSQACATHYARSDLERFKAREFFQLSPANQSSEVTAWTEKCRKSAATAALNCRATPSFGVAGSRPDPSAVADQQHLEMLKAVDEQRESLQMDFAKFQTSKRRQRGPDNAIFCKRSEITLVPVYCPRISKSVLLKVPTAAVLAGFVFENMFMNEAVKQLDEYVRLHPDSVSR